MRRQDGERLAGGLEEQRQEVVERRVLLARARHPALVAIAQRRLVAVMAVGDGDRTGRRRGEQRRDGRRAVAVGRDRPTVGGGRRRRRSTSRSPERRTVSASRIGGAGAGRVVVQADDRARVHARRPEQLVAILPRPGQRPLVRAGRRRPARTARAAGGRRSRAASARPPSRGRDRSARRRRSTDAGPCGACRPSATPASVRAARR